MLAQTSIDPRVAWQVVLTLAVLAGLGMSILTFVRNRQVQRREVSFSDEYVTKQFCEASHVHTEQRVTRIEREIAVIRAEMRQDREKIGAEMMVEVGKVHDRVNDVLAAVSELRGELRHFK